MNQRSSVAEHLLNVARRGHEPSQADALRVRARLHARYLAAPALFAPKVAHGLGSASKLLLGKVLIPMSLGVGIGLGGAVAALHVFTAPTRARTEAVAVPRAPSTRVAARPTPAEPAEATQPQPRSEPVQVLPTSKDPIAAAQSLATSPTPSGSLSAEDLRSELDGLRQAQRLLHAGNAAGALLALDALAGKIRGGGLAEERAATRAMALCGLGRHRSAEVAAFLARYPASVHADGVRAACSRASFELNPGNKTELGPSDH